MIEYEKWHGAGNDFVVIDARTVEVPDRAAFARRVCDRTDGVGADGVLFLTPEDSPSPRVTMIDVQPDGSIADMCGNGARIAAKWTANRVGASELLVETPAGPRRAVIADDRVTIDMGKYSFEPEDIPLARDTPLFNEQIGELEVTAVDAGVPHAVAFVEDIDAIDLETIGPPIRNAAVFPEGANVTLAEAVDAGFRQRTFERGVEGETRACGTGAVAIAAVSHQQGRITDGSPVSVFPPGGELEVTVSDGQATLHGPVALTGTGELEVETQ